MNKKNNRIYTCKRCHTSHCCSWEAIICCGYKPFALVLNENNTLSIGDIVTFKKMTCGSCSGDPEWIHKKETDSYGKTKYSFYYVVYDIVNTKLGTKYHLVTCGHNDPQKQNIHLHQDELAFLEHLLNPLENLRKKSVIAVAAKRVS